ncbi:aldehyde dehydrogenase family protein [Jiangella asiatica]|uniref:Aldehyde dehydrogenase family protein n=1 Tax=Jiangella asiatica TaxID=2530372 RepID=A0A4R5DX18_9ACTN|nr:aldehyde dehydrogenase family protein [Jiangella asiatica]TDE15855.1 aldehyde dehydrogenase family protein [Jiangella asiatica]
MTTSHTAVEFLAGTEPGLFVDGAWTPGATGETFEVFDPASGRVLATVADAGADDAAAAVTAAAAALPGWAATPGWERYEVLRGAVEAMRKNQDDLAVLICAETGKPLAEARAEARNTVRFFEWFGHETMRLPGQAWSDVAAGRDAVVLQEPVGVVAAITPWNFPGFMVACKVGAALAAGCPVVLKPAEQTPLTALAIAKAFQTAGLPPGVLNVLPTSHPARVGEVLLAHPDVACVSFTGSRRVGELLMREAAATVKRVLLELGGNAPVVVLDDADLDLAVAQLVRARYLNAGQACVAANRVYVVESVAADFVAALTEAVRGLRVGDPLESTSDLGPMIDLAAVERIEAQLAAAVGDGGSLVTGGDRLRSNDVSAYVSPAIVSADGDRQPGVFAEELFGPLLAVVRCRDADEAVQLANATDYGLAGYVFAGSAARGMEIARRLRVGSVGVNCALVSEPQLPFGGVRASGLGRERGRAGVEEFLETKTVQLGR